MEFMLFLTAARQYQVHTKQSELSENAEKIFCSWEWERETVIRKIKYLKFGCLKFFSCSFQPCNLCNPFYLSMLVTYPQWSLMPLRYHNKEVVILCLQGLGTVQWWLYVESKMLSATLNLLKVTIKLARPMKNRTFLNNLSAKRNSSGKSRCWMEAIGIT